MKKKWIIWAAAVVVVALVVLAAFLIPFNTDKEDRIVIGGVSYEKNITSLDLSGQHNPDIEKIIEFKQLQQLDVRNTHITAEDYEKLRAALPQCNILWSVPVDGFYNDSENTEVVVIKLTQQGIDSLKYFPNLQKVDATNCDDYEYLAAAQRAYPDVDVRYKVPMGVVEIQSDCTGLKLKKVDLEALRNALQYLPKLKDVTFQEELPSAEELEKLVKDFPDVNFHWNTQVLGREVGTDTIELDLSGMKMKNTDELEAALGYMPSLQKVIMSDCGISNEAMDALNNRYPDIRFVWTVMVGWHKVRTDATTFMPVKAKLVLPYGNQCDVLKYCVDMVAIDLGHCEITNCSFVAYMPNLQYLILAQTKISDLTPLMYREKLVYLELFTCANIRDYSPLVTLKNLEDLNICYTWASIDPITQMTWLKNLWWSPGAHRWQQVQYRKEVLTQCLPNTYLELDTDSSTGDGWRELPNYYKQRDLFEMPYFTG